MEKRAKSGDPGDGAGTIPYEVGYGRPPVATRIVGQSAEERRRMSHEWITRDMAPSDGGPQAGSKGA